MSRFLPTVLHTIDFDGDTVSVKLRRVTRGDMLRIAPHLPTDGNEPTTEQNLIMLEEIAQVLPGYVESFDGLVDGNGEPITLETVISEAYFLELLGEIAGLLISSSSPTEKEGKNSDEPLAESMAGEGTPAGN